jgi:hypothetical protein
MSTAIDTLNRINHESHVKVYGASFDGPMCLPGGLMMDPSTMVELAQIAQRGMYGYTIMILAQGIGGIQTTRNGTSCFPTRHGNRIVTDDASLHQLIEHFIPDHHEARLHVHIDSQTTLGDLHGLAARAQAALGTDTQKPVAVLWVFQDLDRPNPKVRLQDMVAIRALTKTM